MDLNKHSQEEKILKIEKSYGITLTSKNNNYNRNSDMYKFIKAINAARKLTNAAA